MGGAKMGELERAALATAAAAAVHAGQPVAVQRSELSERVLASPGAPAAGAQGVVLEAFGLGNANRHRR